MSANSPLVVTSGTTTPNIDLTGIVGSAHGGTGLSSAGVAGSLLQSNGAGWTSATPGFLTSEMDGVIGNEVTNATNATLARSGSGTAASPFTLRLNLGNANTWIAAQTFSAGVLTNDGTAAAPAYSFSGDAGTGMFHSAANTLNFVTGGTSRMSISSTGVISGDGSGLALGQTIYTASGTASLSVANTAPYAVIPGLTQTFTLPAASIVYIQTDGGMQTTSPSAGGFSGPDIQIFVDGLSLAGGTARLIVAVNLPDSTAGLAMIANWAIGFSVGLTPGSHTIDVRAAGAGFGGGTTATVSSGAGSLLQAKLNIIVLKQ